MNKYNIYKQTKPRKSILVLATGFRCLDLMIFIEFLVYLSIKILVIFEFLSIKHFQIIQ